MPSVKMSCLDERLDDAIKATRGVIAQALARRSDRSAAVEPELARLNQAGVQLSAVSEELAIAAAGHSK